MKKKCILKLQNRQVRFHCSIFRYLFWFRNELFFNLKLTKKIYPPVESLIYKKMQFSLAFKTVISQAIHVKEDFWNLGDCSPCQGWITRIRIPLCSSNPVRSHDRPSHMEEQSWFWICSLKLQCFQLGSLSKLVCMWFCVFFFLSFSGLVI